MAEKKVPYLNAYGNITKGLEAIKKAKTPTKFSQDYLATTLQMPGGSAKPLIPFLKKTGFLRSAGEPTELYVRFRNEASSGAAAADALRVGYADLYNVNEYIHDADDDTLKGVITQVTGAEANSTVVKSATASFKALRAFADFDAEPGTSDEASNDSDVDADLPGGAGLEPIGLNLGYTINLHLPATSDIAVFNAIFKSLRDNILTR